MKSFPYQHISVLILPTDYCNMNCVYCFNSQKTNFNCAKMSLEIVEKIFSATIPNYKKINFIWHGGEPMAMGRKFYEEVINLQKKININNAKIENISDDTFIQTIKLIIRKNINIILYFGLF